MVIARWSPDNEPYAGVESLTAIGIFGQPLVVQGKVWNRIKGFFRRIARATKKALPIVKKIVAPIIPVLPPPVGTIAAAVSSGVDIASTAVSTIASAV